MKVLILILPCIAMCLGSSVPVIKNTRSEGCVEGVCNSHCKFEGNQIFPGEMVNEHGKCRMLKCTTAFDIQVTPCPHDETGYYEWVKPDHTKAYPECCGTKKKKF